LNAAKTNLMPLAKDKAKMKFCPQCRNMLYSIDDAEGETGAMLSCRKCEYKEAIPKENPIVYEHILRKSASTALQMNPYLKYDPTLEHLSTIVCPNQECPTRTEKLTQDVVPVQINGKDLVWMYQCTRCSQTWTQKSRAE
jgi:DNA-directed RNA polymerase subunit M/transcription elongation factor TFIIS